MVVAVDVVTKQLAEQRLGAPVDLAGGARLSLSHNSGVAFGGLSSAPDGVVLVLVIVCVAALAVALVRGWLPAGTLAVGLWPEARSPTCWTPAEMDASRTSSTFPAGPLFNVADIAITFAVVALVLDVGRATNPRRPVPTA